MARAMLLRLAKLFDLIDIQRNDRTEGPARSFKDYKVTVGEAPEGVEIIERL
jgi:CRISPR-associated protein Csd2